MLEIALELDVGLHVVVVYGSSIYVWPSASIFVYV